MFLYYYKIEKIYNYYRMKVPTFDIVQYIEEEFGKKIEIKDFRNFIQEYIQKYKHKGPLYSIDEFIQEYLDERNKCE